MKIQVKQEWTEEDVRDFLSDFHNVDINRLNDSTKEVFRDQYDLLMSQGVGRVNAELMAAGIEWYLDRLARKNVTLKA